jgi:hypothetical protein
VIFTLPSEVIRIAKACPEPIYNALFKAAWYTIKTLSGDTKWIEGEAGMIALLHTWGQNLSLHPHVHCLVSNGAWDPELKRWVYPKKKHFLFPVRVMRKMFRGEFMRLLHKAYINNCIVWNSKPWMDGVRRLLNLGFIVFSKLAYGGPPQIIQYLARYSHRVAITDQRILSVTPSKVSFRYKDYRDGKKKILSLTPAQFVRRFLLHVLPRGFGKIRHYGILSNRSRGVRLPEVLYFFERGKSNAKRFEVLDHLRKLLGEDFDLCPICKQGRMIILTPSNQMPIRGDPRSQGESHPI